MPTSVPISDVLRPVHTPLNIVFCQIKSAATCLLQKAIDEGFSLSYVPCVANQAKGVGGSGSDVPFEEALKKLETLVEAMESGDLPLESLLEKYEEGSRLVKICQAKLEEAELKIQKLEKSGSGEFILKPQDPGPIQG